MTITTLFDISDAAYFHDPDGTIRTGTVIGIDAVVRSDYSGGVYTAQSPEIQYKIITTDLVTVPMVVTKAEADVTGTAPPPPPGG